MSILSKLIQELTINEFYRRIKTKPVIVGVGTLGCRVLSNFSPKELFVDMIAVSSDYYRLHYLTPVAYRVEIPESEEELVNSILPLLSRPVSPPPFCFLVADLEEREGKLLPPLVKGLANSVDTSVIPLVLTSFYPEDEVTALLCKLLEYSPCVLVLVKEVLERKFSHEPVVKAVRMLTEHITQILSSLIEILLSPGILSVDLADLKSILRGGGFIGLGYGPNMQEVLNNALRDIPKTVKVDLATDLLLYLWSPPDTPLSEVSLALTRFVEASGVDNVLFGLSVTSKRIFRLLVSLTGLKGEYLLECLKPAKM